MALNLNNLGKKTDPVIFNYDEHRVILYNLGIGASTDELDFIYEKNIKVFPTFAVIPSSPAIQKILAETGVNKTYLVHGEEQITLHRRIPTNGSLHTTAVWASAYDKGDNGAVITIDTQTKDDDGQLIFETQMVLLDRSAGNFAGDRGPKTEKMTLPETETPDFQVEQQIPQNQAAIYRLSGDTNPLHIDPDFAEKAGFPRPILHGLCSFGFSARALINSIGKRDPDSLKLFSARFAGVVFPGETLLTEGWKIESDIYALQTMTSDGRLVLNNGKVEVR